jgi:hypothetical protein
MALQFSVFVDGAPIGAPCVRCVFVFAPFVIFGSVSQKVENLEKLENDLI